MRKKSKSSAGKGSAKVNAIAEAWSIGVEEIVDSGYRAGLADGMRSMLSMMIDGSEISDIVDRAVSRIRGKDDVYFHDILEMALAHGGKPLCHICGCPSPDGKPGGFCTNLGNGCGGEFVEAGEGHVRWKGGDPIRVVPDERGVGSSELTKE